MIIREYRDRENSGKMRDFVELQCDNCNSIYSRQKRYLAKVHGCSPRCLSILKGTRIILKCAHCQAEIEKSKSKVEESKSGLLFCNRVCKEIAQTYMPEIMPDHYGTGTGERGYRKKAIDHFGAKCKRCDYTEHIAAIVVHHKDHNRENNDLSNLEVLCANCHAIHHWGH